MKLVLERVLEVVDCNVNNIWPDDKKPADYDLVLKKTHFDAYIDRFHESYHTVSLVAQKAWMTEASLLFRLTGTMSKLFEDELAALPEHAFLDGTPWFVRTDNVSLKTGLFGAGPYRTLRDIAIGAITSSASHDPLKGSGTYYLLPWIELVYFLELRVFVYHGNVTAMSQQHLYEVPAVPVLERAHVDRVLAFFDTDVRARIGLDTYSFDVGFTESGDVYFIEANGFGAEYAAGSGLFHWVRDASILEGDGSQVVVRHR